MVTVNGFHAAIVSLLSARGREERAHSAADGCDSAP